MSTTPTTRSRTTRSRTTAADPITTPRTTTTDPRTTARARRRLVATLVGLVALGAPFGAAACGSSAPSSAAPPASEAGRSGATDAPSSIADGVTHVARPTHAGVEVHAEADTSSPVTATIALTTSLGSPTTLLVLDHGTSDGDDQWVQVALASRPNGSQGWIHADDVTEQVDDMAVEVDLHDHVMRVTRGGQLAVETPVAVGADATPTPTGRFYVTDVLDTGRPTGAYGPFALGLSAHSDVLDQFAGGDGQIGIHGTNEPSSIGTSASHGCVRVPNDVISALAGNVPLGTPVTITA